MYPLLENQQFSPQKIPEEQIFTLKKHTTEPSFFSRVSNYSSPRSRVSSINHEQTQEWLS